MIIKPDYNVVSLFDINFKELKAQGIKAILFDLDSTVMPSKSGQFTKPILDLFEELQQNFVVAIISNNKKKDYIVKAQNQVPFRVIGEADKPNPKVMREYLSSINILPTEAVMVGDRPLTDILAGKFLGSKTILVDSITKDTENKPTRFVRFLERLTIKK